MSEETGEYCTNCGSSNLGCFDCGYPYSSTPDELVALKGVINLAIVALDEFRGAWSGLSEGRSETEIAAAKALYGKLAGQPFPEVGT